jgi:hypothetical protein
MTPRPPRNLHATHVNLDEPIGFIPNQWLPAKGSDSRLLGEAGKAVSPPSVGNESMVRPSNRRLKDIGGMA